MLAHYQDERRSSEQAKSWLAERGVDDDVGRRAADRVRQPHPRLPPARSQPPRRGEAARPADASRHLPHLGPRALPGMRGGPGALGRWPGAPAVRHPPGPASVEPQWAAGLPGGMFNEAAATTNAEVIVVASIDDALAVRGAGHRAVRRPGPTRRLPTQRSPAARPGRGAALHDHRRRPGTAGRADRCRRHRVRAGLARSAPGRPARPGRRPGGRARGAAGDAPHRDRLSRRDAPTVEHRRRPAVAVPTVDTSPSGQRICGGVGRRGRAARARR